MAPKWLAPEIKGEARDRWASTPLGSVMRPLDQLRTIPSDMPAIDALTLMGREDVNQVPEMSGARFEGVVELNSPGTPMAAARLTPLLCQPSGPTAPLHARHDRVRRSRVGSALPRRADVTAEAARSTRTVAEAAG